MSKIRGNTREGRPPSYERDDLARAVAMIEAAGDDVTPATVKEMLVKQLGISAGINRQSLEAALKTYLEERQEERLSEAIRVLPESIKTLIHSQAELLERHLLEGAANSHGIMKSEMDRELEIARSERRQLTARCAQLEAQATKDAETIDVFEARVRALEAEQQDLLAKIAAREAELATLQARSSGQQELVAAIQAMLSGRTDASVVPDLPEAVGEKTGAVS